MQWKRIALGIMVVLCMFAIYQAGAQDTAAGQGTVAGDRCPGHGPNPTAILDRLEAQGYDVSAIRAAIDGGDTDTARTLLDQFREEHPDALPAFGGQPGARGPMDADRLTSLLERLSEKGYDVSEIQSALDNESLDTAMKLLRKFMEEHREELGMPDRTPPADEDGGDYLTRLLQDLAEQGYDVSAIQAAVESGDMETARTLLHQFRQEHPDALPQMTGSPEGAAGGDRLTGLLDQLAEEGYDVSAIQAAVDSGDNEAARTLLHQFMEEHRDEFPKSAGPEETAA
ncbi:MAG: tetratricopeptide repeat protein [Methanomicrobiales archaeon]|nr:tetratricopeptide repeat protein [Methanomicrobiales archaeon]